MWEGCRLNLMHVFSLCHSDYVINAVTAVEAHGLVYLKYTLMSVSFSEVLHLSVLFVLGTSKICLYPVSWKI